MLEIRGVHKRYGGLTALEDVGFSCKMPELLSVLGPSGAGKSTVLKIIAGLVVPDAGQVMLDGKDISAVPPEHRGAVYISQEPSLFPHLTVEENMRFGLELRGVSPGQAAQKVAQLAKTLELTGLEARKPHALSGGQRQRVAIGRALAVAPRVLLMDEPFSSLDLSLRTAMGSLIRRIRDSFEVSILMVTHDPSEAMSFSDQMILLDRGRILQAGSPKQLYRNPATLQAAGMLGVWGILPGRFEGGVLHSELGALNAPYNPLVEDGLYYRPQDISVVPDASGIPIESACRKGLEVYYRFLTDAGPLEVMTSDVIPLPVGTPVRIVWRGEGSFLG